MSIDLIKTKLENAFPGAQVEVKNTTSMHQSHGSAGLHLKTKIIFDGFKGIPLIERHRKVYDALEEEMKFIIHALSIEAKYES
ncbi:MAG: BolA family transcriptional regulator [Candidatus Marinimicrobia bacterium]|mgnify:CR=1 FL=1|nr:BolA family transcriptional regulator [Candidatus Neomarinimicrobiota bacterium]|tara:strand:+ start:234 stop:482 length:249 start_codon:yes stop_codon:yes gene_type:complete